MPEVDKASESWTHNDSIDFAPTSDRFGNQWVDYELRKLSKRNSGCVVAAGMKERSIAVLHGLNMCGDRPRNLRVQRSEIMIYKLPRHWRGSFIGASSEPPQFGLSLRPIRHKAAFFANSCFVLAFGG